LHISSMKIILTMLLFLSLISCDHFSVNEVTLCIEEEHFWEAETGRRMWYTLEYFNGRSVVRQFVSSEDRRVTVPVYKGSTCLFLLHPLGSYAPFGGGFSPGDESVVFLHQREGGFAKVLFDALEYNPSLIKNINYKRAYASLQENYDPDDLYYAILDGSFTHRAIKDIKTYNVEVSGLPTGRYIPETDADEVFHIENELKTIKVSTGVHRYLNLEEKFVFLIAIDETGKVETRTIRAPEW